MPQHPGHNDPHKDRAAYPGPFVDANALYSGGDFVSDQAFIDASYCVYVGAANVLTGSERSNVLNGTTQNVRTQTYGQMCYQGGFGEHPPSAQVEADANAYVAWAHQQRQHG